MSLLPLTSFQMGISGTIEFSCDQILPMDCNGWATKAFVANAIFNLSMASNVSPGVTAPVVDGQENAAEKMTE